MFFTAHHLEWRLQRIEINALRVRNNNKWLWDGWRERLVQKKSYNHSSIFSWIFLATLSSSNLLQHACVSVWEVHSQNWSFFMVLSTEKKVFHFYQKSISTLLIFLLFFINISLQLCVWMIASMQLNTDGKSLSSLAHDIKEKCRIWSNWKY